mmetsp:Transcript_14854/g.39783  ORF Transcript_14854/g.39783 Transcript_14854/m.39783 type:complete len:146 (+) Transcript_14854:867-1304(+)
MCFIRCARLAGATPARLLRAAHGTDLFTNSKFRRSHAAPLSQTVALMRAASEDRAALAELSPVGAPAFWLFLRAFAARYAWQRDVSGHILRQCVQVHDAVAISAAKLHPFSVQQRSQITLRHLDSSMLAQTTNLTREPRAEHKWQ